MDPLFAALPEELKDLSDEQLQQTLDEHVEAAKLIDADDGDFLKGLTAEEIIEQYKAGAEQIKMLRAEQDARVTAHENFLAEKAKITSELEVKAEDDSEEAEEAPAEEASEEEASEDEAEEAEEEAEAKVEERELVTASAEAEESKEVQAPRLRRPPAPTADRVVVSEEKSLSFVASGLLPSTPPGQPLKTADDIAGAIASMAKALGTPSKNSQGREDKYIVASLDYSSNYPEERQLHASDWQANSEKIAAIGSPYFGEAGIQALLASGGLCAPLEPFYSMPNLATDARPVKDALPNFRAARGGINVPTPTTMGDADGAITVITEAEDALGGTFATKACLDMECPTYTETAVTIISHCREFGNLNAMAWPEKIRHENALTMAEHARVAEGYLLDQIKALSVNVTVGAETLGALIYLMDGILKSAWGIRTRLRMPRTARFQLLAPQGLLDVLHLDTVQTIDGNRFKSRGDLEAYLAGGGVDVSWYIDSPSTGTSQIADSAQTAAAIDPFPDNFQMALFPAGTFLHIDMAELNLGLVRDSTLNSTNDFQIFGEVFENVARIGPEQAAHWITADICAVGLFPPAGTARTCD